MVQRDGLYAHEVFPDPPYDGVLVSKMVIDGPTGVKGKITTAQRQRFYREGVYGYFRIPKTLWAMGDCGSFSYIGEYEPPFSIDDLVDFYAYGKFSHGIALDHVIPYFEDTRSIQKSRLHPNQLKECERRKSLTLELASKFLVSIKMLDRFIPYGVAQGWSPMSYADSVTKLQKMGYKHIAIGGLVRLKTKEILTILGEVNGVRNGHTKLHLLGIARINQINRFARLGVSSFDSTTPLTQGFKATKDNYYFSNTSYIAIGVPQTEGNNNLLKLIQSGKVAQKQAIKLESKALADLVAFNGGDCSLAQVLKSLSEYEQLHSPGVNRQEEYKRTLSDQPWKNCECQVCKDIGIHVVIKRGTQRNRRRGFHNIYVTQNRLRELNEETANGK